MQSRFEKILIVTCHHPTQAIDPFKLLTQVHARTKATALTQVVIISDRRFDVLRRPARGQLERSVSTALST
jgi:hypothetical protein